MSNKFSKIGHNQLAHLLAKHLAANPNRMIWEDLIMGSAGNVRPDVFTIMKSYSKPQPTAYEIKVSVSDFRSDATTGKWMRYLDYAQGVYFVVPLGMITKTDIPDGAGLITYNAETEAFKTVKKPTLSHVIPPFDVMMKLLINGIERHRSQMRVKLFNEYKANKEISQKFGEETRKLLSDRELLKRELERLELQCVATKAKQEAMEQNAEKHLEDSITRLWDAAIEFGSLVGAKPPEYTNGGVVMLRQHIVGLTAYVSKLGRWKNKELSSRISYSVDSIISELQELKNPVKLALMLGVNEKDKNDEQD